MNELEWKVKREVEFEVRAKEGGSEDGSEGKSEGKRKERERERGGEVLDVIRHSDNTATASPDISSRRAPLGSFTSGYC